MKIIYINIDMLLFSCRSRMVFKLGRITKQSWRVLCSSLKRQCFCSGKRQRSKSRNILGITKKILRGYIFKLFWIYILPFCPGFFRQPLRKKLKISISFYTKTDYTKTDPMILPKVFRNAFFVKESITEDQISVAFSYFLSLSCDLKKYRINPKPFNTEVLESYQGYRIISNNFKGSSAADLLDFRKCSYWLFSISLSLEIWLHILPMLLFNVTRADWIFLL